jgi:CHAT domain-containing protein
VYYSQGRYEEALKAYGRALAIREKALGSEHPDVAQTLNNLAVVEVTQRNWADAQHYWERATHILERRTSLGATGLGQPLVGKAKSEAARSSKYFQGLVKAAWWRRGDQRGAEAANAMFVKAQWAAASEAAEALAQMAVRGAKDDPKLATLARERQDLLAEWKRRDEARTAAASTPPEKRNKEAEAENVARISTIEARIGEIDTMLKDQFPDFAALASVAVASMADVQAVLRDDEALLMFLDSDDRFKPIPEETFIWVITKNDTRWVRSELGTEALRREVAALRCGLDRDRNWSWEGRWQAQSAECRALRPNGFKDEAPLPFDLSRAHALYKSLFGEIQDLIKDKHLLIVPSGALNALPLQVLVTEQPADALPLTEDGYAKAKWLGARNALTVLPAVSSLKALRITAKPSLAADAYIGFGNPLLTGLDGTDRSAWDHQHCRQPAPAKRARVAQAGRAPEIAPLLKGGLGNVEDLRRQNPLPETAEELCTVARDLGMADPDKAVNLGAKATEAHVKTLSASGTLARARVVHFATHGLVAGETAMFAANHAEPALLLTPPKTASEEDDGLLTASEVAALKLDADWVILSACNTAAGDTIGGDALSGLARAFFYAGARSLLVSHWYVNSKATVALVTKSFDALKADPNIGRAEALRRAIATLMARGGRTAHPAAWAPFVVVGEGGVAR